MGAEAQWYQQQLAQIALTAGRKKRSLPVPGTIPGLVPGSPAEAQWYQAQLVHQQQLIAGGRKKRSAQVGINLPVSGTIPGLVPGSIAEAQWYQQQLTPIAITAGRRKRSLPVPGTTGLVPGSAAEAQWYQQQLAQIALLAGRKKRSAQVGINLPVSGTIPGLVPGSVA